MRARDQRFGVAFAHRAASNFHDEASLDPLACATGSICLPVLFGCPSTFSTSREQSRRLQAQSRIQRRRRPQSNVKAMSVSGRGTLPVRSIQQADGLPKDPFKENDANDKHDKPGGSIPLNYEPKRERDVMRARPMEGMSPTNTMNTANVTKRHA